MSEQLFLLGYYMPTGEPVYETAQERYGRIVRETLAETVRAANLGLPDPMMARIDRILASGHA